MLGSGSPAVRAKVRHGLLREGKNRMRSERGAPPERLAGRRDRSRGERAMYTEVLPDIARLQACGRGGLETVAWESTRIGSNADWGVSFLSCGNHAGGRGSVAELVRGRR